MPGLHSSLSPSSAHRYRRCPGSVAAEKGLPDSAGIDAAHGTVFHEFAALAAELGVDPLKMIGGKLTVEKFGALPFTTEMATKMLPGLALIESLHTPGVTHLLVEVRVSLAPWLGKGQFGTSDVIIIDVQARRIVVFDWKWGAGVPVSPVENDQAILYGLGVWETVAKKYFDGDPSGIEVLVVIEQPRADGGGGIWETTMEALLDEGEKVKRDVKKIADPKAPRNPGPKQCKFCKAAKHGTCREYHEFNADLIGLKFDEVSDAEEYEAPALSAISPAERSVILMNKAMILKWLEDLHAAAYKDAEAGRPVPGMKLVKGRAGARTWKDEAKAELILMKRLGEKAHTKKLISPTQAEEALGRKSYKLTIAPLVVQGEAKPSLVSSSDKRAARATYGDKYDSLGDDSQTDESVDSII